MGEYIRNIATTLIGQLGITVEDMARENMFPGPDEGSIGWCPHYLWERRGAEVKQVLRRMRPETLGRIAAHGVGCDESRRAVGHDGPLMYAVHCETWLDKLWDGMTLLIEIAATAVVAEMADILEHRRVNEIVSTL